MATQAKRAAPKDLFEQGRVLEKEGKMEESIKRYHKALSKDPVLAGASNRLMILYRRKKDHQKKWKS